MEKILEKFRKVMHANEAAAWGAVRSKVQVISAYPITPQTTVAEKLADFVAKGYLKAVYKHTESEASAAALIMAASRVGARAFTATSSQGLWLMAEQIYSAGLRRLPLVLVNVNRTLGPSWNILASHEDSLALRDIPWLQFYAADAQEVFDSIIIGYKIAEQIYSPVMVNLDGFYLSHASEAIEISSQDSVDNFLPGYKPLYPVDFEKPLVYEPSIGDDYLTEFRYILTENLEKKAKEAAKKAHFEFQEIFGRKYEAIETYKMEKAKIAIIALGSVAGTIKSAIENLDGVGLIRIRMFKPFPKEELMESLRGVETIAVIDRDMQKIVWREIRGAFYAEQKPKLLSFPAGLGGRDVSPRRVLEIIERTKKDPVRAEFDPEPIWIDLKETNGGGNNFDPAKHPAVQISASKENILKEIPGEEYISAGEFSCQGCGMMIASRFILKGLGKRTFELRPACCGSVVNGRFPNCASLYPLQNVCFEEAAAEASGARAGFDALEIEDVNVLAFAGDGGTYDIGLQALSGAAERNDDIIFVCYDNEAYMNTGVQRSSSTPFGAWSSTTPDLKSQPKKDIMAIMAAHKIPYAATASIAYPEDLLEKIRKAKEIKGFKFILVFSSCPPGWKFSTEKTIEVARLAVETRIWPLYEIFNGEDYKASEMPKKRIVEQYLKIQGRFSHLKEEDIVSIQKNTDKNWLKLEKLFKLFQE
ncbi:MAG: thiamine pyrophosphate-dependent enzyme [Patescibacteria group bacterium]